MGYLIKQLSALRSSKCQAALEAPAVLRAVLGGFGGAENTTEGSMCPKEVMLTYIWVVVSIPLKNIYG